MTVAEEVIMIKKYLNSKNIHASTIYLWYNPLKNLQKTQFTVETHILIDLVKQNISIFP